MTLIAMKPCVVQLQFILLGGVALYVASSVANWQELNILQYLLLLLYYFPSCIFYLLCVHRGRGHDKALFGQTSLKRVNISSYFLSDHAKPYQKV